MFLLDHVIEATKDTLHSHVSRYKATGYRFVTITCTQNFQTGGMLLYVHFDKDLKKEHIRLNLEKGGSIESISSLFWAALLVENEIEEQYGVKFENKVLDFAGRLMLAEEAPQLPLYRTDANPSA